MTIKPKHVGSSLDSLLEEEGILSTVTDIAIKRVLAWQVAEEMKRQGISKAQMARRMGTSRAALERLIDPENASVTLRTVYRAASVLGKQISLKLVDAA
ncbi:MAG: Fis family transcriptional regulator [Deltaproteobacteria bacterium RIFOXYA12_FULL_58_15]|nr:MAG: Fis family transcriptional regulator [Deltaproteobacteria bacterium RIFOXYA12_FULL_58_15]OGR12919.1 MAG: Fis family transcriptional regulator [Deltaproteobacteria bacterium RIFOXYB12_FULL_58_9]